MANVARADRAVDATLAGKRPGDANSRFLFSFCKRNFRFVNESHSIGKRRATAPIIDVRPRCLARRSTF